jgi:hypothetical protein
MKLGDISECAASNSNAYARAKTVNMANKIATEEETAVFITADNKYNTLFRPPVSFLALFHV